MNTAALQNSKHTTAETVISARSLRQVFSTRAAGTVVAVDSIDLTVKRGEIIALLGPNGAGKTTLIDMILGLTQPSGGELSVFGRNASEAARAGLLGAVQQTGGLLKDLTIRATVEMIAALYPKPIDVDEVLAGADLTDIAKRKVGKCSGGQQQRLRYALATMHSPELLILDEPTAGMDVNARAALSGSVWKPSPNVERPFFLRRTTWKKHRTSPSASCSWPPAPSSLTAPLTRFAP